MHLDNSKWSTKYIQPMAMKTVDLKLKVGGTQGMSFLPVDWPLFYDWDAKPSANVREPKWTKKVLWKRGAGVEQMITSSKDGISERRSRCQ